MQIYELASKVAEKIGFSVDLAPEFVLAVDKDARVVTPVSEDVTAESRTTARIEMVLSIGVIAPADMAGEEIKAARARALSLLGASFIGADGSRAQCTRVEITALYDAVTLREQLRYTGAASLTFVSWAHNGNIQS